MKPFIIAANDLKQYTRDRTGLLMTIAMPLILILVLGFCLTGLMDTGYPKVSQFAIGIVDEDGGFLVDSFREALAGEGLKDLLTPIDLTRTEAEAQIRDGKLAGAVVFPAGYSNSITAGDAQQLTVLLDTGSALQGPVIQAVVQGFNDRILAVQFALAGASPVALGTAGGDPAQLSVAAQQQLAAQMAQLGQEISARLDALSPRLSEELSQKGAQLSAMQYYTIAMTVMFLGFAGMGGLQSIIQERDSQTLNRVLAAPGSRLGYVMGKFLGVLFIAACQFAVLLIGTHFIFRVSWGTNLPGIILLALGYSFMVSGLATLVSAFSGNSRGAIGIWVLYVQLTAALGGSMVPVSVFPDALKHIASWLPNNWAMTGFFNLASGEPLTTVTTSLVWLFVLGAVCLGVGASRLARD